MKQKGTENKTTFKTKNRSFHKEVFVIEEEGFSNKNSTEIATFYLELIKRTKFRYNLKPNFPRDRKQHIWTIAIKMVGSHRLSIYCVRNMTVKFSFISKSVE